MKRLREGGGVEGPLTRDERRLYFILQHLRKRAGWGVDCPNGSESAEGPSIDALSSHAGVEKSEFAADCASAFFSRNESLVEFLLRPGENASLERRR